jgi:hypothetical protein
VWEPGQFLPGIKSQDVAGAPRFNKEISYGNWLSEATCWAVPRLLVR